MRCFGLQTDNPDEPEAPEEVCEVHPGHMDALNLFLACLGQLQLNLGMGGTNWRAAQAVNVLQEAKWQGLHGPQQAAVVSQYRVMEREALQILNEREAQAAKRT